MRYLVQVFPEPGKLARAVNGPGGSRNLSGPLHHFLGLKLDSGGGTVLE